MPKRRNPVFQWLVYRSALAFGFVTARLPLCACRALGRVIGRTAYCLVPRMRRIGMANLDLAYGDTLDRVAKQRILKEAAENMGIVAAEFSHIPRIFPDHAEQLVSFEGLDNLDLKHGSIFIGGHLGNWEWMAPALASHGFDTAEIVRPLDNPKLNAYVDAMRRSGGIETVPKDNAGIEVLRLIRNEYQIGLLVDQSPRTNGIPVRFFGQDTWGTIGPAMISARAGRRTVLAWMTRDKTGRYTLRFSPMDMAETGSFAGDLAENAQRCQTAVEAIIRDCPEQWLWFHRRWKPRPRLEEEHQARLARHSETASGEPRKGS